MGRSLPFTERENTILPQNDRIKEETLLYRISKGSGGVMTLMSQLCYTDCRVRGCNVWVEVLSELDMESRVLVEILS